MGGKTKLYDYYEALKTGAPLDFEDYFYHIAKFKTDFNESGRMVTMNSEMATEVSYLEGGEGLSKAKAETAIKRYNNACKAKAEAALKTIKTPTLNLTLSTAGVGKTYPEIGKGRRLLSKLDKARDIRHLARQRHRS